MKRLVLLALVFGALVCAADDAHVQKIVPIKNGDFGQMFQTVRDLMQGQVNVRGYQNNLVLSGSSEAVAAAEQLIKNLENSAPRERNVDVTGYIILAGSQADAGGPMPPDLEPVLKQFRSVLNYKSFRIVDTVLLRTKENVQSVEQGFLVLPNAPSPGATSRFLIDRTTITDDVVHLKGLNLRVEVPVTTQKGEFTMRLTQLATDADVKVGQKVAIGKATIDNNGAALILVVSANVVN